MKYTVDLTVSYLKNVYDEPQIWHGTGEIVSIDFKKQQIRVAYKNKEGRKRTAKFPMWGFFNKYEIIEKRD